MVHLLRVPGVREQVPDGLAENTGPEPNRCAVEGSRTADRDSMTVYRCDCGRQRRRGERVCDVCRANEKNQRRARLELSRQLLKAKACPVEVQDQIIASAEWAFEHHALWETVVRDGMEVDVKLACTAHDGEKQLREGMPAVSTPYFWIDVLGPRENPIRALIGNAERLRIFEPESAKIPAIAIPDRRLNQPAILLFGVDFWTLGKEWSE